MKHFVYFESREGGMGVHEILYEKDLFLIPYWMRPGCVEQDNALREWMNTAEVGEMCWHRLGCMVRMKDKELEPK